MAIKTIQDLMADKRSLQRDMVNMLRLFEEKYGWGLVNNIEIVRGTDEVYNVSERVQDVEITIKI